MIVKNEKSLEELRSDFAKRLKSALEASDIPAKTQAAVAKEFGQRSQQAAANWLNGVNIPRIETIVLMATKLEVNASWLAFGEGPRSPLETYSLPEYPLQDAPVCEAPYSVSIPPNVLGDYMDGGKFLIKPWTPDTTMKSALVRLPTGLVQVCRRFDLHGPGGSTTPHFGAISMGVATKDPKLLHTASSATILGGIDNTIDDPRHHQM